MKVYKACRNSIVTLKLLPDSVTNESREGVIDPLHAKFRTNKAQVVSMIDPFTKEPITEDTSLYDSRFTYEIGEIVKVTIFDNNINRVCASGIHYFKTYETAVSWYIRQKNIIPPDGTWRDWYESGQVEYERTYKNGESDGIWRWWYESGQLASEGTYKNGIRDGTWRYWYENGQLECEGIYKDEIRDGTWRGWHESGQLKYERTYKNGKLDGTCREWYESGQLKWKHTYENGIPDGTCRGWV